MSAARKKKRPFNVTLSESARIGGEAIAILDGGSVSAIIDRLMLDEIRRRGLERVFSEKEIAAALRAASESKKAGGKRRKAR